MDKKALLAFVLCGIIMLYFFHITQPVPQPGEEGAEEVAEETIEREGPEEREEVKAGVEEQKTERVEKIVQEDIDLQDYILIQNDVMKTIWTNEGAALKSVILPEFKNPERTQVLELLKPAKTDSLPLSMKLTEDGRYQLKTRRYKVVERASDRVAFTTLLENGIQITKDISLKSGKYYFDVAITLQNTTDSEIKTSYSITAANGIYPEVDSYVGLASISGIDLGNGKTKIVHTAVKDMPYENESVGISLAGAVNKYFAVVLKPSANNSIATTTSALVENSSPLYKDNKTDDFIVDLHAKRVSIPLQGEIRHDYVFFLGPKKKSVLKQCEDLLSILDYDYGMTRSICKILVKILNTFYGLIPNYGVSILLLTFLVKLVLFPLTRKSQMSMFRMQQLQPLIGQLKEKHKGDKQKMGQEQMKLFKQHGVNPMSGCFPIMLQMPVFFALFRTLQSAFEMRQAPFVLWISDLSAPDKLLQLPFTIPFLGEWFNILPLIMGVASFVQMKLTPKTASGDDPQAKMQQKMMQMMPLIFPVILYNFPSGLTLYWTTSTLISIVEQTLIRRSVKKHDIYYKGKRVIEGKAKVKVK